MKTSIELASIPGGWPDDAPPRSACFGLPPEGESGESCEDLSSYFRRLCACHGIFPYSLASRIQALFFDQEVHKPIIVSRNASHMNGVSASAAAWANVLEKLTLRTDLRVRTMLPLRHLIGGAKLLSKRERFCPSCYRDDETLTRQKYNRLLWAIDCVEACPLHAALLQTAPAPPGHIPFTFWLPGVSRLDGSSLANYNAPLASNIQIRIAHLIADLLDDVRQDPEAFANGNSIGTFFRHAADTLLDGNMSKLSDELHIKPSQIQDWISKKTRPILPVVAHIAISCSCRISDVLLGKKVSLDLVQDSSGVNWRYRNLSALESSASLLAHLEILEKLGVPRNFSQICRLLDVDKSHLRKLAPDAAARIAQMGREDRHRRSVEREESRFNDYWQCFEELFLNNIRPTKVKVLERLSQKTERKLGYFEASKFHSRALQLSKLSTPPREAHDKSRTSNRDTANPTNSRRKRH